MRPAAAAQITCPLVWLLLVIGTAGCACFQDRGEGHLGSPEFKQADSLLANRKHRQALALLARCELRKAEQRLQEALCADPDFGPAHNNLGQLYFQQGKYYQAAWEFEAAAGLLPDRPEPLNNLGLVYEAARRFPDAVQQFQLAHELAPTHPVYLGNLVRALLRSEDQDAELLAHLLDQLLLIETRPEWRDWAVAQQARLLIRDPNTAEML